VEKFLGIKINWKKIQTTAQYCASHSAHGLWCSRVGGPLSSPGRIGTGPGCHDHGGPASPCRRDALGAREAVSALGTDAVARPPASSLGTRCGGTGGVSSSRRRGRRRAEPRGRTLTGWVARRRGGKKKVGAAALLNGDGAPGTSTAPGVALQLREGNERVRPARICEKT
jgi:hypothetical protein